MATQTKPNKQKTYIAYKEMRNVCLVAIFASELQLVPSVRGRKRGGVDEWQAFIFSLNTLQLVNLFSAFALTAVFL